MECIRQFFPHPVEKYYPIKRLDIRGLRLELNYPMAVRNPVSIGEQHLSHGVLELILIT